MQLGDKKISIWDYQLSVFQALIPGASLDRNFCNSLRNDRKPGCSILTKGSKLLLMDSDSDYNGKDIVSLWSKVYNLSSYEATISILNYLNNHTKLPKTIIKPTIKVFFPTLIKPRCWSLEDDLYWNDYYLFPLNYFPIKEAKVYSSKLGGYITIMSTFNKPLYACKFESGNVKVYSPKSTRKFLGNILEEDAYLLEGSNTLFIGAGNKDIEVVHLLTGWTCMAPNGEAYKLNESIINKALCSEKVIVSMDGDKTGIRETIKKTKQLRELQIEAEAKICPSNDKVKDYAEWMKYYGPEYTQKILL